MKKAAAGGKRKRTDVTAQRSKRRKVLSRESVEKEDAEPVSETVLFRPFSAQEPALPPKLREKTQFALLPDWKERFSHDSTRTPPKKPMPADMRQAAEAADEDDTPTRLQASSAEHGEEEDWEDDDDDDGEGRGEDALAGLDPETLKAILKQKLSETGLGNMDEAALEQAIAKMLSGSSDDAAGDLTDLLLGQATENGDGAVSGWLEGQGVQLDREEEEGSVAGGDEVMGAEGKVGGVETKPSGSAVDIGSGKRSVVVEKPAASASGKKRKVDVAEEGTSSRASKRKQTASGESAQDVEQSEAPKRMSKRVKASKNGK